MERGKGIEPSALAWKARVLPLYEPRMVRLGGLEPPWLAPEDFKSSMYTNFITVAVLLVPQDGLEPSLRRTSS